MSAPAPKYAFKVVTTRPGIAPYLIKVRVADCHPENKHHARGVCEECHNNRRREPRRPVCPHCGRAYKKAADEVMAYCSLRCQMVYETLATGDGWRAHWPGARYQRVADVPATCPRPRCGGVFQETDTGVVCQACGTESHVAERLVQAALSGRDALVLMRSVEAL